MRSKKDSRSVTPTRELDSTTSGYVYILVNSTMPGLVKIGSTTMDPYDRAKQLHTTGVPDPFEVYGFVRVADHKKVEKAIHAKLSSFRQRKGREFFKIEPEEAVKIMESISGEFELKRQQDELKRQQDTAKEERRIKDNQDRKMREQFEQEIFSLLEMACEDTEKKVNIKFYKNIEEYSGIVALFLFIATLCLLEYSAVSFPIGIACAFVGLIRLISSKIVKKKFKYLEEMVASTMEEIVGATIWQGHKGRCVEMLYKKYHVIKT